MRLREAVEDELTFCMCQRGWSSSLCPRCQRLSAALAEDDAERHALRRTDDTDETD